MESSWGEQVQVKPRNYNMIENKLKFTNDDCRANNMTESGFLCGLFNYSIEGQLFKQQGDTDFLLKNNYHDMETPQHNLRMSSYCAIIGLKTGMSYNKSEKFRLAAQMHDIGKIGVPESILLKPGKLTVEEFEIVKQHSEIGYRILSEYDSVIGTMGSIIARTHHERYDGSGYPFGLAGDEIPKVGRISAICDVFDALTSDRVYKKAIAVDESVEIMRKKKGSHFDHDLFDIFESCLGEILHIKAKFDNKNCKDFPIKCKGVRLDKSTPLSWGLLSCNSSR